VIRDALQAVAVVAALITLMALEQGLT